MEQSVGDQRMRQVDSVELSQCRERPNNEIIDPEVKRYKRICLFWLFLVHSARAFNGCIDGPTVPDFRERLHLTMEEFSRSAVTFACGLMLGALISGVICDRFARHLNLFVALSLGSMGASLIIKPWSSSLVMLSIVSGVNGFSYGFLNTASTNLHLTLFGSENLPMYIRHFGWTAVCPFVPLLVKNYLSSARERSLNGTDLMANMSVPADQQHMPWWRYGDDSRIEVPYAILGCLVISLVPVYIYYQSCRPPKNFSPLHPDKTSFKQIFSPGSCAGGSTSYGSLMTLGIIFYHVFLVAADLPKSQFEFSYVIDSRTSLNMTKDTASYLSTASNLSHSVSRILCIILMYCAPWIKIQSLMRVCVVGQVASFALYVFVGLHYQPFIWLGTILIELFQQPMWPASLVWAENYIIVYSIITALAEVGQGFAGMISVWIYGRLYDLHPALPFYVSFSGICAFALNFVCLQGVVCWFTRKDRNVVTYKKVADDDDSVELLSEEAIFHDQETENRT